MLASASNIMNSGAAAVYPATVYSPQIHPGAGPSRRKEPLPIPCYMPANQVFQKYKEYLTKDLITRVAVELARKTYFGLAVLEKSSLSGTEDSSPLDPNVLGIMKEAIREKFMEFSPQHLRGSGGNAWSPFLDCAPITFLT